MVAIEVRLSAEVRQLLDALIRRSLAVVEETTTASLVVSDGTLAMRFGATFSVSRRRHKEMKRLIKGTTNEHHLCGASTLFMAGNLLARVR